MTLSQDELRDIFKNYLRFNIDVSQGMNYYINSKYVEGNANFLSAINTLEDIIKKIESWLYNVLKFNTK